jgi:hypothetical protein
MAKPVSRILVINDEQLELRESEEMKADRAYLDQLFVDFNPFLFHNEVEGALIRLSANSLLNVTSGGGQTALLVLED